MKAVVDSTDFEELSAAQGVKPNNNIINNNNNPCYYIR
jgi:hypothetical protein